MSLKEKAKKKVGNFFAKKHEGVNVLIASLGMCALVVAVIVLLNTKLIPLMSSITDSMATKITAILG